MDVGLEIEVQGEAAEFAPVKLRARRRFGNLLKEASDWTLWYESGDLAGTLGQLGTDIKWEFVAPSVRAWLTGAGPFPGFRARPSPSPRLRSEVAITRLRDLLREAHRELSTLDAALAHPDGPDALTGLNQRIAAELGLPSAGDEFV